MTDDLHPATHLRAAAWVPDDDPQRPWDEAIAPAARWLWGRSAAEGVSPLLVSNAQNVSGWGYADLDEITRAGGHATPQSRTRYDRGPVFRLSGLIQLAFAAGSGVTPLTPCDSRRRTVARLSDCPIPEHVESGGAP